MSKKVLTAFFMSFSFVIIALGGYQCATQVTEDPDRVISVPGGDRNIGGGDNLYPANYGEDDPVSYRDSEDFERESCAPGSVYKTATSGLGERAVFDFDSSAFNEYLFGKRTNLGPKCARMYLDMNRQGTKLYKGSLTFSYEDAHPDGGLAIIVKESSALRTGSTSEENKYNQWTAGTDLTKRKFYAIFENNDMAVILQLKTIKEHDLKDGETVHLGYGDLYYKMFRHSETGGKNDKCYSSGAYMRNISRKPPKRTRCWLLGTGPWSCLPGGIAEGTHSFKAPAIDIKKASLPCYSLMGKFFGLKIRGAFNLGSSEKP